MNEAPPEIFSFGMWVRRRRKALDLTQAALAQRVGCAEVTIRKLETDVFRPSREMAERLAGCLDLPAGERVVFLQTARGERSVDRLPTPQLPFAPARPDLAAMTLPIVIPRDTVPAPAPLPTGSRMPLSRNPLFVGREQELCDIATALHVGSTATIGQVEIVAATGLGGIGKTQLVCEFVHRYGQFFPGGVFWLSFADPAAVPAEVAACGGGDGMQLRPEFGMLPLDEQVKLVLAAWESPNARLLIFDNCEDETLLEAWRPKHGGCRVLLTCRRHHWDAALGVHTLPLNVLARPDSLALLRTFRPDLPVDDPEFAAIAEALGDLPLALHLAGSFLANYRYAITPTQYLQRLSTPTILDDRSLRAAGFSPTKHVQHLARTFEQSYERLDPADPQDTLARTLLAHAACFAPGEPLPRWLLLETLELSGENTEGVLLAEDALMRLIDLGLLETDTIGILRLHRLLAAFARAVLVGEAAHVTVEATMLRVANQRNQTRNPRLLLDVQHHLRFIIDDVQQDGNAHTAGLSRALGYHLWLLGIYPEARRCIERALQIQERLLGRDHPEIARTLTHLGGIQYAQGDVVGARNALERGVMIQEQVLGRDHLEVTRSLTNLGVMLREQGEFVAAQRALEDAFTVRERVLGRDHPDTLWSLTNLIVVLREQGEDTQAQMYLERIVVIQEQLLQVECAYTARSLINVGMVLREQGEATQARRYLERALAIQERVLGWEHPETAWNLTNLGLVLYQQGEDAQARSFLEHAATILHRVLGWKHPETARSLANLGLVLQAHGEEAQAHEYLEHARAIFAQRLGPDHPDTDKTRHMLAMLDTPRTVPGS